MGRSGTARELLAPFPKTGGWGLESRALSRLAFRHRLNHRPAAPAMQRGERDMSRSRASQFVDVARSLEFRNTLCE
jgi:hypothetical protein